MFSDVLFKSMDRVIYGSLCLQVIFNPDSLWTITPIACKIQTAIFDHPSHHPVADSTIIDGKLNRRVISPTFFPSRFPFLEMNRLSEISGCVSLASLLT